MAKGVLTAGQLGGRLRPRLGGRAQQPPREKVRRRSAGLPARTQWDRRAPGLPDHARCRRPGESVSGKKQIPNHKNFAAAKS